MQAIEETTRRVEETVAGGRLPTNRWNARSRNSRRELPARMKLPCVSSRTWRASAPRSRSSRRTTVPRSNAFSSCRSRYAGSPSASTSSKHRGLPRGGARAPPARHFRARSAGAAHPAGRAPVRRSDGPSRGVPSEHVPAGPAQPDAGRGDRSTVSGQLNEVADHTKSQLKRILQVLLRQRRRQPEALGQEIKELSQGDVQGGD